MKNTICKNLLLLSLLIFIGLPSFGQSPDWVWAKSIGSVNNDLGRSVAVDDSGNVFSIGTFEGTVDFDPSAGVYNLTSMGILDLYILKLDSSGNFIWAMAIGGSANDIGYALTVDPIGNVYITGRFGSTVDFDPGIGSANLTTQGYFDVFIAKYNGAGVYQWAESFGKVGDDESLAVDLDVQGNIYLTGFFEGVVDFDPGSGVFTLVSNGGLDAFICKLENSGNFIWARSFGGNFGDTGVSIAVDSSSNVYTTGHFNGTVDFDPGPGIFNLTSVSVDDAYICKLDFLGNFVWAKGLGGVQTDSGYSLATDHAGNIFSTGLFGGTADFDPGAGIFNLISNGNSDIFVSGLDSNGSFSWAVNLGANFPDNGNCIAVDANDNIFVTGNFRGIADFDPGPGTFMMTAIGSNDIFISKFDPAGNFLWAKSVGKQYSDVGVSIAFDKSNRMYITGSYMSETIVFGNDTLTNTVTLGATADIFIAKLDSGITTTGLAENLAEKNFIVFPNPASGKFTVRFEKAGKRTLILRTILGEVIASTEMKNCSIAEFAVTIPSGIYILCAEENEKYTYCKLTVQ